MGLKKHNELEFGCSDKLYIYIYIYIYIYTLFDQKLLNSFITNTLLSYLIKVKISLCQSTGVERARR
jgi:hypothetical protein